jgi:hypothetical protein
MSTHTYPDGSEIERNKKTRPYIYSKTNVKHTRGKNNIQKRKKEEKKKKKKEKTYDPETFVNRFKQQKYR